MKSEYMFEEDESNPVGSAERPWIALKTTYDIEAWIDQQNRSIQRWVGSGKPTVCGICFGLDGGGEIFMHTTQEGDVLLDVTPEAEWVSPVIVAATNVEQSASRIWALPGEKLTQLVFGLSSLIATTRLFNDHSFSFRKY